MNMDKEKEIVRAKVQHFVMYAVNDHAKYKVGSEFGHGLGVVLKNNHCNVEVMLLMPTTIEIPVHMIILAEKLNHREMFAKFSELFERHPALVDEWTDRFERWFPR